MVVSGLRQINYLFVLYSFSTDKRPSFGESPPATTPGIPLPCRLPITNLLDERIGDLALV